MTAESVRESLLARHPTVSGKGDVQRDDVAAHLEMSRHEMTQEIEKVCARLCLLRALVSHAISSVVS